MCGKLISVTMRESTILRQTDPPDDATNQARGSQAAEICKTPMTSGTIDPEVRALLDTNSS